MVRSLRGRLLAWQAVLLAAVVSGFGTILFLEVRRAKFDEVDGELMAAARVLEGALRTFPPYVIEGTAPPPGSDRPPKKGPLPGKEPPPRPPGDTGPPPATQTERFERALNLPISFVERHGRSAKPGYYTVWRPNGGGVLKSTDDNPIEPPLRNANRPEQKADKGPEKGFEKGPGNVPGEQYYFRQNEGVREVVLEGPFRTRIVVGRSIEREQSELARLGWVLGLSGAGVFGFGLLGGWWLSRRAVRPIAAMSETAAAVSATSLSHRIDLSGVDTELGELGRILNDMLDRLEEAFDRQARFTADASHELRTPLAVLQSNLELALARPRSPEEYKSTLTTCQRAGTRMTALVEGLLTLAKADVGKLGLKTGSVDLLNVAEETAELLAVTAAKRKVEIQVLGSPVEVRADAGRIAQVVVNLVNNAILYNRPGGRVTIQVATEPTAGVLRVIDTGIGIPKADLPFVFDRFYRVDKARARETGGSGLGLAICKSIIEAHGGVIGAAPGAAQGSVFTFRLPRTSSGEGPGAKGVK